MNYAQKLIDENPHYREWLRRVAGAVRSTCPIRVVPGCARPALSGESYHYRTRGGRRIWHPSAYSKQGFSNMVYVPSERAIEVGVLWLAKKRPRAFSVNPVARWYHALGMTPEGKRGASC